MKLLISFLMIFQMICTNVEFYGKSYIVYDSLNQYVVEGRNIDYLQSVASISKIMTAIVVIENSRLDKKITVDETINTYKRSNYDSRSFIWFNASKWE